MIPRSGKPRGVDPLHFFGVSFRVLVMNVSDASVLLSSHGQAHALAFWDQLDDAQRGSLMEQIEALDFEAIATMQKLLASPPEAEAAGAMAPAPVLEMTDAEKAEYAKVGEVALRAGKVGVILVAGGQGSRLGYEGPKGCYPVGPVSHASLFYFHARKVLALEKTYGAEIPLYVMTSPLNEGATKAFFAENGFFGLDEKRVFFFSQSMWPALTAEGRIILDSKSHIFLGPDGHGGMLAALERTGCLADMEKRGLESIFYFQVDNPMVDVCDPAFMGAHLKAGSEYSVKVCAKRDWKEGLGMVVERNGKTEIVEYSDPTFSDELKQEVGADGRLRFLFGSVAIHVFSVAFLRRETDAGLPLHIAFKKVPYCDAEGTVIKPESPNAYKFEKFIFDALRDAKGVVNVAFDRAEEFSPVKNKDGNDSPATCRRDLADKWGRWLEAAGLAVPRDAEGHVSIRLEIDPCYALNAEQFKARLAASGATPDTTRDLLFS